MKSVRNPPAGFTLFEILLVLVVLVGILGIAWPALSRIMDHHQLWQSAETVQVRLMSARVHALETGLTYQFLFEPEGRKFLVVPYEHDAAHAGKQAGTLATTVHFDAGSWQGGQHVAEALLSRLPDASQLHGLSWSGPLLFFPDGTATTAQLMVRDKKQHGVRVLVRGLTGGVTISAAE